MRKLRWLLWTEWLILSKSVVCVIFAITWLTCAFGLPFIIYLQRNDPNNRFKTLLEEAFTFPTVFNTIGVLELLPAQILSLFIIYIVCQDLEHKTYRLRLINGSNRIDLFLSKFIVIIVLSFLITLNAFLNSLIFGYLEMSSSFFSIRFKDVVLFIVLAIQSAGFMLYAMLFGLFFKKAGLAIMLFLVWFGAVERVIAQTINFNYPFQLYPLGSCLPGKAIEDRTILDIFRPILININSYESVKWFSAFFWIILSIYLCNFLFKKFE